MTIIIITPAITPPTMPPTGTADGLDVGALDVVIDGVGLVGVVYTVDN
jgi:hypothetical protein